MRVGVGRVPGAGARRGGRGRVLSFPLGRGPRGVSPAQTGVRGLPGWLSGVFIYRLCLVLPSLAPPWPSAAGGANDVQGVCGPPGRRGSVPGDRPGWAVFNGHNPAAGRGSCRPAGAAGRQPAPSPRIPYFRIYDCAGGSALFFCFCFLELRFFFLWVHCTFHPYVMSLIYFLVAMGAK